MRIKKLKMQKKINEDKKEEENEKKKKEYGENKKKEKENKNEIIMKLKEENKMDEVRKLERKDKEFWYLDDLTDAEIENLNKENILYIDQGKGNLIYVLNDENNRFMQYSNKERKNNLNTFHHTLNTLTYQYVYGITEEMEKIKEINKKSTNKETVIENIKKINETNEKIYDKSKRKKLRKKKLEMYIDTQKTESKMIHKLVKQLGIKDINELKNYTIIIGDWKGCNTIEK